MKTVIVYESTHHGNTEKLVKAIKNKFEVDLVDITQKNDFDLENYDLIGFASGIAFGKFYKKITEVAMNKLPEGKKVFFLYTYGNDSMKYSKNISDVVKQRNATIMGCYGCKGFDTYGPFKLFGGINKKHPDTSDMQGAVDFYEKIYCSLKS